MLCIRRLVSRATTAVPASFNNLGDIPSGPVYLIFFNNVIFLSISRLGRLIFDMHVTGMEHGLVKNCGAWSFPVFNFFAIVEKKQFIRLPSPCLLLLSCCLHALVDLLTAVRL